MKGFSSAVGHEVKTTIVERGYDVAEGLGKYAWADALFVQTPVYWMSVPYLFKKYPMKSTRRGLAKCCTKMMAEHGRI